ncbi:MAG: DUF805 domain-containing protein [Bacteroidales bacterium]|nr:DUF805 domain-containing protein [Bacteroidales bacterium]
MGKRMFKTPLSFNGRIGQVEYVLSVLIVCVLSSVVVYFIKYWNPPNVFNYDDSYNVWNHLYYSCVFTLCSWVYTLSCWFGMAQSIKRCHDMDRSGWCILIPFYGFVMLFVKGTEGVNKYGPAPESDVATDAVVNSGTMRNPYVRFYLCLMMLGACGLLASILKMVYLNIISAGPNPLPNPLASVHFWIDNVIALIWFLGFVLLFHYRKVAFYVVSVLGLFFLGLRIYNFIAIDDHVEKLFTFVSSLLGLVLLVSVFFLYPMLKKTSEWENLENSFRNLSWKSVLLYWFAIEFGMACYFILFVVYR